MIGAQAQSRLQDDLTSTLRSEDFSRWLAAYFSAPATMDIEDVELREDTLSSAELLARLQAGDNLFRPEHVKLTITRSAEKLILAVYGAIVPSLPAHDKLINRLNEQASLSFQDIQPMDDEDAVISFLTCLYNRNVLFLKENTP